MLLLVSERTATGAEKRLVLIFIGTLAVGVVVVAIALREVGGASRTLEAVLSDYAENVLEVEHLNTLSERVGRVGRSYLLTGDAHFLSDLQTARQEFAGTAALLRSRMENDEQRRILDLVHGLEDTHERLVDAAVERRQLQDLPGAGAISMEREVRSTREELALALDALSQSEQRGFELARAEATANARESVRLLLAVAAGSVILVAALTWLLGRTLADLERSRRALDASMSTLERANRDLDAFAGRIAHDLRNILAPLPLNAARLRRGADSRELVEACADKVERVARRADGLIEALLAFARAGQPPDTGAAASVRRAVTEAVEDASELRALVGADVAVEIDDDPEVGCGDSLLYTVVANLLTNALKFVEGRPRRQVRIRARPFGSLCELSVEDTGPGIPAGAQGRIFEPFYRAPGAKGGGTGIGLATVQRIVEAHGGLIAVQSSSDGGACFLIRLPLGRRTPAEGPVPVLDNRVLH
jgi:signal transduction histidine kinase